MQEVIQPSNQRYHNSVRKLDTEIASEQHKLNATVGTTVLHTGLTTSVEGGVSSFELCPGMSLVTTRVASIGKSFEIDDAHLLTALGTHCQCQLWRQYYQHGFTLLV